MGKNKQGYRAVKMPSTYYILEKDSVKYRTTSKIYWKIATEFQGYKHGGIKINSTYFNVYLSTKLLPRLSKEQLTKYKVALRLMK